MIRQQANIDRVGMFVSLGCAVHCMLLPLIITALPLIGLGVVGDVAFERWVFGLSIILASVSLCWGTRQHRQYKLLLFIVAGVLLILASGVLHSHRHVELGSSLMSALAGLCFVVGHYLNLRLCRSCHTCEEHSS